MKILVYVKTGKKQSRVVDFRVVKLDGNIVEQKFLSREIDSIKDLTYTNSKTAQMTIETVKRPINGEANKEIINILSEFFKVPKTKIILKSGGKNKTKIFN